MNKYSLVCVCIYPRVFTASDFLQFFVILATCCKRRRFQSKNVDILYRLVAHMALQLTLSLSLVAMPVKLSCAFARVSFSATPCTCIYIYVYMLHVSVYTVLQ